MERDLAREAGRVLLHTILFCRSLGALTPIEVDSTMFPNVTYLRTGEGEVDECIESGVENFMQSLQVVGPDLHRGEIVLSFFEHRKTSSFLGMKSNSERVVWEQWVIPLVVSTVSPASASDSEAHIIERTRRQKAQEQAVQAQIQTIVSINNSRGVDYFPPFRINSNTALTYKFEVSVLFVDVVHSF